MKLFNFGKKNNNEKLIITQTDREWVEDSFQWLIQFYSYPARSSSQIIIDEISFPQTLKNENISSENILSDLVSLLHLNGVNIKIEYQKDIRDSNSIPYEIEGTVFESKLFQEEDGYIILIANNLLKYPKRLMYNLIYECIQIRLYESGMEHDAGEDVSMLTYIAGIYMGFGVLLSQNLINIGSSSDGIWGTKWNYVSDMKEEVMAYALATYATLIDQDNPSWKSQLPADLQKHYDRAIVYLNDHPVTFYNKRELDANDLFDQSTLEYDALQYEKAISTLQKILFLTEDVLLLTVVYNNIGYYQIRKGDIKQSIQNFKKALEFDPYFGFANDNLGYALIRTGELEEGKGFLQKAFETDNNDHAYSYRNLGLYYQAIGDHALAEHNFQLAFDTMTDSVDLLEYHYSDFLLSQGKMERGMNYLQLAVEKGEPEAIEKMKHLHNN